MLLENKNVQHNTWMAQRAAAAVQPFGFDPWLVKVLLAAYEQARRDTGSRRVSNTGTFG